MKNIISRFSIAAAVSLILTFISAMSQAQQIDDPFAHYKMDDNAQDTTVVDAGQGSNHGIATSNTVALSVLGQRNSGFDFKGTDRVDITALGNQIKNDQIGTIAFWIKPGIDTDSIFSLGASAADTHFNFRLVSGKLDAVAQHNTARVVQARGTTVLSLGQWFHCAFVQDGNQMKLYINGAEENVNFAPNDDHGAWLGDVNGSGQVDRFILGGTNSAGTGNTFLSGVLDDFRYYRRALSAQEIQTLYTGETIDPLVWVKSHKKISSTEGNFNGPLANGGRFGRSVKWLGHLGPGAPTPRAVAVGNAFDGPGAVWILFLNSDGTVAAEQKIANGEGGLPPGTLTANLFGVSVSSLGDLDGDHVIDIAVGESNFFAGNLKGAVWILRLNSDGTVKAYQKIAEGAGGFPSGVLDMNDDFGNSLAFMGDLDNDGLKELAVGAPGDDDGTGLTDGQAQAGAVWILSLNSTGMVSTVRKISQSQGNGPILGNNDLFGTSLAWLGNLGTQAPTSHALAVGAILDEEVGVERGAAYILFLNSNGTVNTFQKINDVHGNFSGVLDDSDRFGVSLESIGDLDGDGVPELAAGAYLDDDGGVNRGATWLLFLNADGTVKAHEKVSGISGGLTGTLDDHDHFGIAVSSMGDLDGDGTGEIIVGADLDDDGGADRGAVWILSLETANKKPIADAGLDQTVHPGIAATLDGSGSFDPDGNTPLTFLWTLTSKPAGSTAQLIDPASLNPTITPDVLGNYVIELVVTDSLGAMSASDEIIVSTENTAPVADAGLDQAIITLGTVVQLDGSQSYDDDGFTYFWNFTTRPLNSLAELDDPTAEMPTFIADVHGDYVIQLIVTDVFEAASAPDSVKVSFDNIKPVAHAGMNQSVLVGENVSLNGHASSDANLDSLTYNWSIVSAPLGSQAEIQDPQLVETGFIPDLPGTYVISLVVNDGFENSELPSNITVVALTVTSAIIQELNNAINAINVLDNSDFKNTNMRNTLTNKINAVLAKIADGDFADALNKLQNDILGKTDGCAERGNPDPNDWIITCVGGQNDIYPFLIKAIMLLQN